MTLTELKRRRLDQRASSIKSIESLAKKQFKRPDDAAVGRYVSSETARHKALIEEIDADLRNAGIVL